MAVCGDRRGDLAAHVLGALDPAESAELQRHVSGCGGCAAELAELAGLPDLLALVPAERVVAGPTGADAGFADRLVAAAARRHRVRRRRLLAAVAAGLIVAGAAVAASGELHHRPAPDRFRAADAGTGVTAQVTLRAVTSGTAIALHIDGVPARASCVLVAVARDGRHDVAGSWQATYSGSASLQGSTAIAETQLTSLVVDTTAGRQLISIPVGR